MTLPDIPFNLQIQELTYNEALQGMTNQLSDKFFYISLILFVYVLMNMFVFYDGARFKKYFDKLDTEKYILPGIGTLGGLIFVFVKAVAFSGSLMLVMLNIIYRMGLKI